MKTKHTKGEWYIMEGGFEKGSHPNKATIYATNNDLEIVCKISKDVLLHNKDQDFMANAKLIKSSPTLLEYCMASWKALNDAHSYLPPKRQGVNKLFVDSLQEVIKKATQ